MVFDCICSLYCLAAGQERVYWMGQGVGVVARPVRASDAIAPSAGRVAGGQPSRTSAVPDVHPSWLAGPSHADACKPIHYNQKQHVKTKRIKARGVA